jgi:hypothetical protein
VAIGSTACFIAGGKYHDIDFARLGLVKLLAEDQRVRVRVFEDYSDITAISCAQFLVSYTCDVTPDLKEQEALRSFIEQGRRWYALHGTNSILRFLKSGEVDSPRWAPHFMKTLGSMFISHPPIAPYRVTVADPEHPLISGVEPFDATDELYLLERFGDLYVLLETEFEGRSAGFPRANLAQGEASGPVSRFALRSRAARPTAADSCVALFVSLRPCDASAQQLIEDRQLPGATLQVRIPSHKRLHVVMAAAVAQRQIEHRALADFMPLPSRELESEIRPASAILRSNGSFEPALEEAGWKLIGAYQSAIGPLNTVIDLWEVRDPNAVTETLACVGKKPDFAK